MFITGSILLKENFISKLFLLSRLLIQSKSRAIVTVAMYLMRKLFNGILFAEAHLMDFLWLPTKNLQRKQWIVFIDFLKYSS